MSKKLSTFFCKRCRLTFQRRIDLVRHKRIHLNACRFACHVCSKTFSRRDRLKCHVMVHLCGIQGGSAFSRDSGCAAKTLLKVYAELSQRPLVKSFLKRSRGKFAARKRAAKTENKLPRRTLVSPCQPSSQTNVKATRAASYSLRGHRLQTPEVERNNEGISHQLPVKMKVLCPRAKRNIRTTKSVLQGYVKKSSLQTKSADRTNTASSHNEPTTANQEINKTKATGRQGPLSHPVQQPFVRLIRLSFASLEKVRIFIKRERDFGKCSSCRRKATPVSTPLAQESGEVGVAKKPPLSRPTQQPFVRLVRHSFSSPEKIRDFVKRECALAENSS
ncbi:uncharacterized protein [Penaeus vannamei]|uniref:uncharacterized protein n=1 Tax=Penaeus vannamei TaxID=6689 RepID=UPI00387F3DD5